MKKVLSLILACVLMCAVLVPCSAAGDAYRTKSSSITLGMWPQSRVTSEKELAFLKAKLVESNPNWIETVLPNNTVIRYCDVSDSFISNPLGLSEASARPTYRAVRINGCALQWYRWEPLTWHFVKWHDEAIYVCDSLVAAVSGSGANPAALDSAQTNAIRAWLATEFYETAFSNAEKMYHIKYILTPTVSMTQGFTAAVGDYVALSGANGANYFKTVDPAVDSGDESRAPVPVAASNANTLTTAAKNLKTAKNTASDVVGVLPILCPPTTSGGGLINWILRLFGH